MKLGGPIVIITCLNENYSKVRLMYSYSEWSEE